MILSLFSKSDFYGKFRILCQEVVVENTSMEWYKIPYLGFDDLQIHEITQYALVFYLFKKPKYVSYKRNLGIWTKRSLPYLKKISTDYEDMQKT